MPPPIAHQNSDQNKGTFTPTAPCTRLRPGDCPVPHRLYLLYLASEIKIREKILSLSVWQQQEASRSLASLLGRAGSVPIELEHWPVVCPAQTCFLLVVQCWRAGYRGICPACPDHCGKGNSSSGS